MAAKVTLTPLLHPAASEARNQGVQPACADPGCPGRVVDFNRAGTPPPAMEPPRRMGQKQGMSVPRRRWLPRPRVALALLPLVAAILWHLGWRQVAAQVEAGFDQWVAQRRAAGWNITHAPPHLSGWPLAARLTVPDLWLSGKPLPGQPSVSWSTDRLDVAVIAPRLRELHLSVPGQNRLRFGAGTEIPFAADTLTGVIPLLPGVPPRGVTITGAGVRAGLPSGPLTIGRLTLALDTVPDAAEGEAAVTAAVDAADILPGRGAPVEGPIARLAFRAILTGPIPSVRLAPAERVQQWREGGGTLAFEQVDLAWGGARLTGGATLTLDDQQQPMGTAEGRLAGAEAAVDALATSRAISPPQAMLARVMARALSRPATDGVPTMVLNATLQDSTLSMPPLPPLAVPPVSWPW